jgi:hypothetical protein
MSAIESEHFTKALFELLDEAFDNVHGYFLDKDTSLFETLADISADEASIPVGGKCATLAAQVKHVAYYLDVVDKSVRDPAYPGADWGAIWRTVNRVTPDEWDEIRGELRQRLNRILNLIKDTPAWPSEAEIAGRWPWWHTRLSPGEIRQALCTLTLNSQMS